MKWTLEHVGCYADGANGHQHARSRIADLLEETNYALRTIAPSTRYLGLANVLRDTEMSDDAQEEYDAIDVLNDHTDDGLYWDFRDGDFGLWEAEED